MNLIVLFSILLVHWVADFVLQTDEQAKGKSKDNKYLTAHVMTYSICWIPFALFFLGASSVWFILITYTCHWITDYFTSRLNSRLYAKGDIHNFFVSVGFDQVLHYTQLILTYLLLI